MFKYEECLEASLKYYNGNELAAKVFLDKYALRKDDVFYEKTPDDMHRRIARELARVESKKFKKPLSEDEIYEYLKGFKKISPQGSPMYGIGNPYQTISLSNCFLVEHPLDSYSGILHTDQQLVQISKRRGGVGLDISNLRPENTPTNNASRASTGIIPFMERFSNSIREVGQSGRRGALMITLDVHHPQISDFIKVKRDLKKVTGANISTRLSDEFLEAVDKCKDYQQRWPVDSENPSISKMVNANLIWDEIIDAAWTMAEPGIMFWGNIIKECPANCYAKYGFKTSGSNPCSELTLCCLDSCRLLLLNLFTYIKHAFSKNAYFDFEEFYKDSQVAQRLMDDIVDLEIECIDKIINKVKQDPEDLSIKSKELEMWNKIKEKAIQGRRTGTGITALGDTIAALGLTYGSEKSIKIMGEIYNCLKLGCYRSSVDMAKELGTFPIWEYELEKDNPFLNRIKQEKYDYCDGEKLYNEMKKYGRRNIALLTTAPAGTVSINAAIGPYFGTTSGIEPVFKPVHTRRKKINPGDSNFKSDFIDQNGDHWQEFKVYHQGVQLWMDITGETDIDKSPYHKSSAEEINWKQRVKLQGICQKHVDHAISSTINLPEDVSKEEVSEIYKTAWKHGCKGITVYRNNCRTGVLVDVVDKNKINKNNSPVRPKELPCDVYNISVKGKKYFVLVGLLAGQPYEVFAGKNNHIFDKFETGTIVKVKRGHYKADFGNGEEISPITLACDEHEESICRLTSMSLRHGADIRFIVEQLSKVNGEMNSFAKSVARALKKYIKDGIKCKYKCTKCGSDDMVYQEGCPRCNSCGDSKCQ